MFDFTDFLTSIFVTIQGASIQISPIINRHAWRKLIRDLNLDDGDGKKSFLCGYMELLTLHILFGARVTWNFVVWLRNIGWNSYKYYVFRSLHEYFAIISIALMVHINIIIKNRFRVANEILLHSSRISVKKIQVRQIEVTYRKLTQQLERFNRVFGYQMLFIMANAILVMLESLRNALKRSDFSVIENVMVVGWSLISTIVVVVRKSHVLAFVFFFLLYQVEVVSIVISCDCVTREAERIVGVCQRVQEDMTTYSWERREIFKFLLLVNTRKPLYSAADYFIINRSTLFGLLGVTTTYFIILVQFSQMY